MTLDFLGFQVSMLIVTQLVEIIFCWPCENFKLFSIELQTVFQFPIFINYISLCTMQREELFLFFLLFSLEKYFLLMDPKYVVCILLGEKGTSLTTLISTAVNQVSGNYFALWSKSLFFSVDIMVFDFLYFLFFQMQCIHYYW